MSKKILIHCIAFSPDAVSTAYLYNDIALKFKEAGYLVSVLTTTPHYNALPEALRNQPLKRHFFGLFYTSDFNGIIVKHIPQKKFKQAILRIIGFLYWHFISFFMGLFEKSVDIIISPSPPLTIGFINILLAKLKGAKVIYNVQEIYPDFLIEQGGLKSKYLISIFKWLERFVYNRSDVVTTIDQVFYDTIVDRFDDKSKLHIIPNFVDTKIYRPIEKSKLTINKQLFPDTNRLKLMYAGNIGHAQDWQPLLDAAFQLRNDEIDFFIIGEGVMKDFLIDQIEIHNLKNVYLIPYQPREIMPELIAYADLQFIFMSAEMEGHGFPSKVYTIMACAKPLLICSGVNSPIYKFLENLKCAYLINDRVHETKVSNIVETLRSLNWENLKIKGLFGLQEVIANYSSEVVAQKYVQLASSLLRKNE